MDQETLIARVAETLRPDERVRALFVSGSFGRGTADAFSDVDLLAILDPADHEAFAADWFGRLDAIMPLVFRNRMGWGTIILNAIDEDWTRCDIDIATSAALVHKSQDGLRPLIDRDGLYATVKPSLPPKPPSPERIAPMINEFIRVLGLAGVAAGRDEWVLGAWGVSILRGTLIELMTEANAIPDPGGALHLKRILTKEQMAILEALPAVSANRASVLAANRAIATAFLPLARRLAADTGLAWPDSFEAAARKELTRAFGDETPWP